MPCIARLCRFSAQGAVQVGRTNRLAAQRDKGMCRLAAQRWPPKAMDLRPMPVASFEDAFGLEIANLGTYDVESKYETVLSPMVPRAALHLGDAGD